MNILNGRMLVVISGVMMIGATLWIGSSMQTHLVQLGSGAPNKVHLGDTISIVLDPQPADQTAPQPASEETSAVPEKKYQLYLADIALPGFAQPAAKQKDGKIAVKFTLEKTSASEKAWSNILHQLKSFKPQDTHVCIEPEDHSGNLQCSDIQFRTISKRHFLAWFLFAVIVLGLFLRALTSPNSQVLRDTPPARIKSDGNAAADTAATPAPAVAAFSLGRVQMAFWFVLVVLAFVFIWLATGAMPTLNESTLALIGIGSGAALGAALIDENNGQVVPESVSLLHDLLTDKNGYSFHRVQLLAWTLVLGVAFVSTVMRTLSMPDFDATLLALMGISSGTYLGFKLPEMKAQ